MYIFMAVCRVGNQDWTLISKNLHKHLMCSVPHHHQAHITMFEYSERCETGRCRFRTQDILPERESEAKGEDDLREFFDNGRL
ncbi:hypothetical protein NPIL_686521 [Nephila pilipes]|uniref:Uncharacterized protein n=1 Tax=Nephila pilipes TaxID=299642 RepID=A0A8X6NPQ0_NEPPI|nr:hypothetical protein NPIL_686521 [Nephila pilipes]